MKIQVTQDHIDRGVPKSSAKCPIAISLGEHTETPWTVSTTWVCLEGQAITRSMALPPDAQMFIAAFDAGFDVNTLEFDLPLEEVVG